MLRRAEGFNADLLKWPDIETGLSWKGLLVGNGASRAVWDEFKYDSLYELARSAKVEHPLSNEDCAVFEGLDNTRNFEAVLGALSTSRMVCDVLGIDNSKIVERHDSIRYALVEAVKASHVPWQVVPPETLRQVRRALSEYEVVYSTNYDLLLYWAYMSEDNGQGFKDYFWGERFDVSDSEIWNGDTRILYLHGALHLYHSATGGTLKQHAGEYANLLDLFGKREDAIPLFISEGSHKQKLAAIARSDYLAFALEQFSKHAGPLVVFGHGLGDTDKHLADAMKRWGKRTIAYGIYPAGEAAVIAEKGRVTSLLPRAEFLFFDSTTHPLGDPALRVSPNLTTGWAAVR